MNSILGGGGFHHVCVKTRNWESTRKFYCDTLGFTEKVAWRAAPERAAMFDSGDGNYVEVFEDLNYQGVSNGAVIHFALRTTRLNEVAQRVRDAGWKITVEPKDVTIASVATGPDGLRGPVPVRIFFCEGPNGEILEFFQNTLT
ncbi:MAG: VOC family protein [Opitutus sp.]